MPVQCKLNFYKVWHRCRDLLRNKVSQYVLGSLKRNAPSPYKHFPLRENELVRCDYRFASLAESGS